MSNHPIDGSEEGEAPSHLSAGFLVGGGRHTLVRQIARGGMGVVWLAHDERLNESVALKFLSTTVRNDLTELARLRQETQKSRKLTHANIIRIYDLYEEPGEPAYISMEYVNGPNLWELAAQQPGGVFTWGKLKPLVKQMCDALAYAHSERVIHRDLKPTNLMLAENQRIKLADFGMATAAMQVDHASVEPSFGGGTFTHMSPQQLAGKVAVETDDIYSLGATLYDLLCGHPPFYKGDVRHQLLHAAAPSLVQRLAALPSPKFVPKEVSDTIMACLAKDPSERPKSASAAAAWMGLAGKEISSRPIVAATVSAAPKTILPQEAPPRGHAWRWWTGAGVLACVGVVSWFGHPSSVTPSASLAVAVPTNGMAMTTNALVSESVRTNDLKDDQTPAPALAASGKLRVISAVYGSGEHFADVTSRVEELMRGPSPEFFTNPDYLQADPTPGWNKSLIIVYEFKGQRHLFTAGEHGEVNLTRMMEQAKMEQRK